MKQIRVSHELDCSADHYWSLYMDEKFTRTLFEDHMGWDRPRIDVTTDDETEFVREMDAQPKLDIPGAVARLISKTLGYHEDGRFDKATKRYTLRHRTNVFGDKMRLEATFTVEDIGEKRCRRKAEVTVDANIFGVAGLIERTVENNVRRLWDDNAKFTNDWMKKNPE